MATQDKDRRARVMASELMHVGVYTCMCSRVHAYVANPHSHPKPHSIFFYFFFFSFFLTFVKGRSRDGDGWQWWARY